MIFVTMIFTAREIGNIFGISAHTKHLRALEACDHETKGGSSDVCSTTPK